MPRQERHDGQPGRAPEARRPAPESHATSAAPPAEVWSEPAPQVTAPIDQSEPYIAPVTIHVEPESASIHAEPPPAVLHVEPTPKVEPSLAESVAPVERPAPLPRNAPEIPKVSLELPPESGLILVETSHAAPSSADETEAPRPRRVRPPRVEIADEPLQIVETTHKDSTPPA
jgi:hypothetical protein